MDSHLVAEKPDLVLAQGDTTTVFCAALAAFYHRIPFGHVETGLRTGNFDESCTEEATPLLADHSSYQTMVCILNPFGVYRATNARC